MRIATVFALTLVSAAAMADPLSSNGLSAIDSSDEISMKTGGARYSTGGVLGYGLGIHRPGGAGTGQVWGDPHIEEIQPTGSVHQVRPLSFFEGDPDRPIISDRVR